MSAPRRCPLFTVHMEARFFLHCETKSLISRSERPMRDNSVTAITSSSSSLSMREWVTHSLATPETFSSIHLET